jgi:predicted CXXCH cytochrome family protein
MGATPAFADNGPHVSTTGNATVDRCAGCHRAHTAQDSYLLKSAQTSLCTTCHDGTGATTDVVDGMSTSGSAALRGGGFTYALIGGSTGNIALKTVDAVTTGGVATTSQHNVGVSGIAWGGGASGKGTSIVLECGSCHDPHGNGNYRILRPLPTDGVALALPSPVAVTSVTKNATLSSGTTYYYDVVAAANTFKVTDPVTFAGTTTADGLIGATVKVVTDTTHFTVSMRSVNITTPASGGVVGYADPLAIAGVTGSGTAATYKTFNVHGLSIGQTVTITGILPATYNVTKLVIASVPSTTTFTVANTETAAYTSGGKLSGIADALGTKVYTTTNYWAADDHNYTGVNIPASTTAIAPTAFIANISQWCSTCHTRVLAGSGAWDVNSGDAMYTFKHRSQNGKEYSPNCIQCHVAHGSNARMTGSGPNSNLVGTEITGTPGDSFLLRVDNRGTCNMCHNL